MSGLEVTVAAPLDTVWKALRDKEVVRRWHGWDYDGLDAEVEQIYFTDVVEDGHVLALSGGDRFRLIPLGEGTAVVLDRAPRGDDADAFHDLVTEGWTTFLQQLRFAVERQPGVERRTLYFSGDGPATTLLETVDLDGEPWFRSANQVGVTVDAWGEGLLVLVDAPSAMAVLSTYGLDDEAFAELETRWTALWAAR